MKLQKRGEEAPNQQTTELQKTSSIGLERIKTIWFEMFR